MYLLRRTIANLRERGVVHTVRVGLSVLADASFDWHHGTDTRGRIRPQDLDLPSRNRASAVSYRPSKAAPLQRLLRHLDLPRDGTFVDLGSGKGRVLIIAAQLGFARVIGVELSHDLCVIARCNVDRVDRRTKARLPIEIVEADVTEFRITPDQHVFFLFNPFTTDVMAPVLQHIQASVLAYPRPIWLIYSTPLYDEAIVRSGLFAQRRNYVIHGSEFAVFAHKPATIHPIVGEKAEDNARTLPPPQIPPLGPLASLRAVPVEHVVTAGTNPRFPDRHEEDELVSPRELVGSSGAFRFDDGRDHLNGRTNEDLLQQQPQPQVPSRQS